MKYLNYKKYTIYNRAKELIIYILGKEYLFL